MNSQNEAYHDEQEETTSSARRGFIKQAMFAALVAGISGIPREAKAQDGASRKPIGPLRSQRLLRNEHIKSGARQETTVELEMIGINGVKAISSSYLKRIDTDTGYDIVVASSTKYYPSESDGISDSQSSNTVMISGVKGPVQGTTRLDQITTTLFQDGTLIKTGPLPTPVLLNNPYEKMSDQEMVDAIIGSKFKK